MDSIIKMVKNLMNPFERLPEDVVILIMKKLPDDLKFLRQCSLVSKQFASAILRVPQLKLTLPMSQVEPRYARTKNLQCKFSNLSSLHLFVFNDDDTEYQLKLTLPMSQVEPRYTGTTNLLCKFSNLSSLNLLVSDDDDTKNLGRHFRHMKVKAEAEFYTVAYIHSCSIHKMDGDSNPALMNRGSCRFSTFVEPILWHDFLVKIIRDHPMLHSVQISSPGSFNQAFFRGEELIKLKNLRMQAAGSRESGTVAFYLQSLILPVSGHVMKDVHVYLRRIGGENMLHNVDDIIDWDYEEDEKVFGEALKLVLMKYKH